MARSNRSTRTQGRRCGARTLVAFIASLWLATAAGGLEPDELLLLVNANVPQGAKLAQLYAEKRQVPAGRILELNLPTAEEMPAIAYDRDALPVVREFLRSHGLERKVRCIVPFYGVPIRIGARQNTAPEQEELAALQVEFKQLPAVVEPVVQSLEEQAAVVNPAFKPGRGTVDLDNQARRAEEAIKVLVAGAASAPQPAERARLQRLVVEKLGALIGAEGLIERHLIAAVAPTRPATTTAAAASSQPATGPAVDVMQKVAEYRAEMVRLQDHRYDATSRQRQRVLSHGNAGPFGYARVLQSQIAFFQTENTGAAFDSELSLMWWDYPRANFLNNPLHYANVSKARTPPVVMTMRLDGAQAGTVSQIILSSLKAEADGLTGRVVIDSRGLPVADDKGKRDAYGEYDQTLRNLADLIQAKTKLSMTFDDRPEVMQAGSVRDVAVYMGWYSVAKYVPACEFHPGAVAWHLASYTMVTLRREDPRCWARDLLNDGAAATLGAVAEPYLGAFPRADDFFPLLFTGKLTLAEVYWRTTPLTSWQISMIGDPLYAPYRKNPGIAIADLPDRLKGLFKAPPTPATVP